MKKILFDSSGRGFVFLLIVIFSAAILSPTQASSSTVIPLGFAYSRPGTPQFVDFGMVEISQVGEMVQFDISGLSSGAGGSSTDLLLFYFNTTTNIPGLSIETITPFAKFEYSFNSNLPFFMADGGGFFDGYLDFSPEPDQVASATILFKASDPLSVSDFLALSSPSQIDRGVYPVAVYLQNTNAPFQTEFVGGVPIPGTLLLFGSGLLGLGVIKRKKFFSKS